MNLFNILFLDIETVSMTPDYDSLPERYRNEWDRKASYFRLDPELDPAGKYLQRAGIYAEFGKVVCIGLGYFVKKGDDKEFRTMALHGSNENVILKEFVEYLKRFPKDINLCAHNGKEFDYPYLCRRLIINGIALPPALDISGKKPWEVTLLDTMDYWKFGDFKAYTSLELLATVFDLPSSKDDIKGSDVSRVYYESGETKDIARYCVKDVVVTARIFLRQHLLGELPDKNVIILD